MNYGNERDALSWMWNIFYMGVKSVADQWTKQEHKEF